MSKKTAIIVDDEESARNILSNLLANYCPEIDVVEVCEDVEQAVVSIKKKSPDLVFLDIEMPNYSGYEIVNFFDVIDFDIIFVTAYNKYAVKAFEVSALDYLMKPIEIDRLKTAVQKFLDKSEKTDAAKSYAVLKESFETGTVKKIIVPHNGGQRIIETKDIIAISASESYSYVYTEDNKYLVSKNLKQFENSLSDNPNFIRVHKSWIVSQNHIVNYNKSALSIELTAGITAKLSKYKKADFEEKIVKS